MSWLILPGSALFLGLLLAGAAWSSLPAQVPTHWGVDGADMFLHRGWAVALVLGMSAASTLAASVFLLTAPHSRNRFDVCVIAGITSWIGLAALASGAWPHLVGLWTTTGLIVPVALAYLMHRRPSVDDSSV